MATIAEKWFEQGRARGIEQGLEQGLVRSIIWVLARRFGDVPPADIRARLERVPATRLETLLDEALVTADLDTFVRHLTAALSGDTTHSNGESE